jgi:Ca2+-binding RTX toxin-like protein
MSADGGAAIVNGITVGTGFEAFSFRGGLDNDTLSGAAGDDHLHGQGGGDRLSGGGGDDRLKGREGEDWLKGGAGQDTLTGGIDSDAFVFGAPSEGGDVITDFGKVPFNNDYFRINATGFGGGLVAGTTLDASRFQVRDDNIAQDSDDRFIFRTTDATLWFDSNGNAAGGLTMVADLQAGATVTAGDILLV